MTLEPASGAGRILIIDDDPSSLAVTSQVLESRGYETFSATEWAEITQVLFREGGVDLVLVDMTMPAVRGDRLVPILARYAQAGTPIVLYSGLPEDELRQAAKGCGASGYLQKGRVSGFKLADAIGGYLSAARGEHSA
jgi:CheY-like chemotaxis protein